MLVAHSAQQFIADFANDLGSGLYHLHADALADDKHFLEAGAAIDIINWENSAKWKRCEN